MNEARQHFQLVLPPGPLSARVRRPADWETVTAGSMIELEVEGRGDLDVYFLESRSDAPASATRADATLIGLDGASGQVRLAIPSSLAPGPYVVQFVRRFDGKAMAILGVMIALDALQRDRALSGIRALRRKLSAAKEMPSGSPLFSITTTCFDTPLPFWRELAELILAQSWPNFEWLILDNGSQDPGLIAELAALPRRDPRVRHFRVDKNIHIIPGNRYLLERATGQYIVPLDSDDLVAPDALERLALYIGAHRSPTLVYSDELKVAQTGVPAEYLWRSGHDPLNALATCPASHLMAFRKAPALDANLYGDAYAQGSHDWDSYLRLCDAGADTVHVPEVLYGWRMHSTSAAGDSGAKDYLFESQLAVVQQSLMRRGLHELFDVRLASGHVPLNYFHAARRPAGLPALDVDIVVRAGDPIDEDQLRATLARCVYDGAQLRILLAGFMNGPLPFQDMEEGVEVLALEDEAQLVREIARSARGAPFKAVVEAGIMPLRDEWLREAVGTLELDPAVGIVGGCLTGPHGEIVHLGFVAALDGWIATPRVGQALAAVAKDAAFCRRRVTAVHGGMWLMRTALFDTIGAPEGQDFEESFHGIEFCLRARRSGWHTAYCPTFAGQRAGSLVPPAMMEAERIERLRGLYGDLLGEDPYYNPLLSQRSACYGELTALR